MPSFLSREKARQAFEDYVGEYDCKDAKVKLKILHTYRVADLCDKYARELGWSEEEVDLVWLIGLLHDIGRFEQIKNYGTFRDDLSEDHAALGVKELKKNNLLHCFIDCEDHDDLILEAIGYHNVYELPPSASKYARLLRDADKTDIFHVRLSEQVGDYLGLQSGDVEDCRVSEAVMEDFRNHSCILSSKRATPLDLCVSPLAFVFGIYEKPALRYIEEHDYIHRLASQIDSKDDLAKAQVKWIEEEVSGYLHRALYGE